MTKVILIDADGVILKKQRYFSEQYAEEKNIPIEPITSFFSNEFKQCMRGQSDLKEALVPYLRDWKWDADTDAFLKYWFDTDVVVDENALERFKDLKKAGKMCYLASNQEKYRAAYISNVLADKDLDGFFFSHKLGIEKPNKEFFENIIKELGVKPEEIEYYDDDPRNVDVAKSLGIKGYVFKEASDIKTA